MPFLPPNQQRQSTEGISRSTTTQQQLFYGPLSGTTRVSRYQKKHSPTYHPDHHPIFISFFHLPRSIASSVLKLRAWQSFCTTSLHVLFGLPLGLEPSTSYFIHFFTQSVSSSRSSLVNKEISTYNVLPVLLNVRVRPERSIHWNGMPNLQHQTFFHSKQTQHFGYH